MLKASYNDKAISNEIRNCKILAFTTLETEKGTGNRRSYHQFVKFLNIIDAING